jgi:mRNA-degrading endonuclease RelE of RelBE toxin-antitoxin system
MTFKYGFSKEFLETLKKIQKKHKPLYEAVLKKIDEIISRDDETIDFYKNLRYNLSDSKRVHVLKHYVLSFTVNKKENHILFQKISHHDEAYK